MLYFVTAARGTEDFIIDELNCKCQPTCIHKTDGKVFFEINTSDSCNLESLFNLKSVERLFVAATHNPDFRIFGKGGVYHFEKALAAIDSWELCLETWRSCHPSQLNRTKDAATAHPRQQKEKEDAVMLKEDAEDVPCKRRKLEEEHDECEEVFQPTFRVSCKCSGSAARFFTPQHLSKVVSYQLRTHTGWKVDLGRPLFEVTVQLNNAGLTIGLPLCDRPLSQRPYIKTIGLRSTLAWILSQLAKVKPGDVVLDPMCGSGTILVEAARSLPDAVYLGSDISDKQLTLAMENVTLAKVCGNVHLFQADVKQLPQLLGQREVDCIICDVPFGINHSCVQDVKELYPHLIRAMESVLALHGRVVVLTSTDLKGFLLKQVELMNASPASSLSLVEETSSDTSLCDNAAIVRETKTHCRGQEPVTTVPILSDASETTIEGLTSSGPRDAHRTSEDSVQCSTSPSVGQETKLTNVCPLPSCTGEDINTVETPVDRRVTSGAACVSEQMRASEATCTESDSDGHVVGGGEARDHDMASTCAVAARGSVELNVTRDTDATLPVDRRENVSQKRGSYWQLEGTHYFKLGETHAHACVFQKKST